MCVAIVAALNGEKWLQFVSMNEHLYLMRTIAQLLMHYQVLLITLQRPILTLCMVCVP